MAFGTSYNSYSQTERTTGDLLRKTRQYKEIPPLTVSEQARFWGYVERRDASECWQWKGSTSKAKYGAVYGTFRIGYDWFKPHRIAFVLAHGVIDPTLTIDHTCQNKLCMNPCHMEQVTITENVRRREVHAPRVVQCKRGHTHTRGIRCRECLEVYAERKKAARACQ